MGVYSKDHLLTPIPTEAIFYDNVWIFAWVLCDAGAVWQKKGIDKLQDVLSNISYIFRNISRVVHQCIRGLKRTSGDNSNSRFYMCFRKSMVRLYRPFAGHAGYKPCNNLLKGPSWKFLSLLSIITQTWKRYWKDLTPITAHFDAILPYIRSDISIATGFR